MTGYDTDPGSEVALQAFSYAQLHAPSSLLLAAVGTVRGLREQPTLPRESLAGFRAGKRAGKLATFAWEDHWATPLAEVRRMLNVVPVVSARAATQAAA